jgi:hypothetical protein
MKWVTALNLDQWAARIDARTQLSEVVSRLVRATATDTQSFRFPTGDSAQIPGYDGRLTTIGVPPYIPDGESVWEFGTDADYLRKASQDFDERTATPRGIVPADTTFVFVTPRRWSRDKPSLDSWVQTQKVKGIWKDVQVLDAVALEAWLEQQPAVAAWVARFVLNLITETGVRSTDEFWEEYAARFKPQLTEKVLLCDREEQSKGLLTRLQGGPQDILMLADSPDEVVAFVVATIRDAEIETRKWLEARTLIFDTEEAARQLSHHTNMVYIPRAAAHTVSGLLAIYNPTIVPLGRDRPNGNVTVLNRPTTRALSGAIETMGLKPDDAYQLARASGRSVTILRRLIPNGDAGKPEWAEVIDLIPALLCGGWEGTLNEDTEILRVLAGVDRYETYEAKLHPLLKMHDPPIDREGEVWKIRAPVDAFVYLGSLVTAGDLDNLRLVATEVFSETDQSLEQSDEEKPTILAPRRQLRHSEWLRDGLATTLLQIAVLHREAGLVTPGTTAQAFVDGLVANLPGLTQDYRLIASLRNQLPLLVETAPRPFLAALDNLLGGDGDAIRPIFRSGDLFSATSPHTYLLWALEPLAWDPDHLSRVALILAKLARIDPGGPTINRPINTLKETFLTWNPNTNATLVERLAVLDQLIAREPAVSWNLLCALLPEASGISHPNARLRYREAGASDREPLTWALIFEAQRQIIQRTLSLVGTDVSRWRTIIKSLSNFEPGQRQDAVGLLQEALTTADTKWKTSIWEILHDEVNRHRSFPTAQWSLKDPELANLEAIAQSITPADPLEKHGWLFDSDYPDMPNVPAVEFDRRTDAIREARRAAVIEIRETLGNSGLLSLAERVRFPQFVGIAVGEGIEGVPELEFLVDSALGKDERLDRFALALSGEAERRFGVDWHARISGRAEGGSWNADQVALLLLGLNDVSTTWDFAESLGGEIDRSYWNRKQAWWVRGDSAAAERAARKFLAVNRPSAGLDAVQRHIKEMPISLVYELLDRALTEIADSENPPNSLFVHHLGELFQALANRDDAIPTELAKREYGYLPLLGFQHPPLTLHKLMAEEPSLYINIISDVFRPATVQPSEPTPEQRARAQAGYELLRSFTTIPGRVGDDLGLEKLTEWTREVRRLATEADRAQIVDQYIGHLLAHAPNDPNDKAWPHRVVRDVIEAVASDDLEKGIRIERFNMRGVVSKALFEGGKKERALADEARTWAKSAEAHLRTASMLKVIAADWGTYAEAEDVRARQDQMKYE